MTVLLIGLLSCQNQKPAENGSFTTASYNLRYANAEDSAAGNGWGKRYPVMAKLIQYHSFDIFGTQEGYIRQLEDMKAALPGYEYIGVGRNDGKEAGEHSAIFYRTDKFDLIKKGDFWLSETPDTASIGWDAVLPRICSWGHFKCKDTGFEFLFFNLHMDHIGKKARVESAFLVQEKMKELGANLPAILTGDFNVDQTHSSYKALVSNGVLKDSYESADFRYATNGTFNSFDPNNFTESRIDHVFVSPVFKPASRIDHIFVSPSVRVHDYGVLTDTYRSQTTRSDEEIKSGAFPKEVSLHSYEARTPSDHFPVKVELEY